MPVGRQAQIRINPHYISLPDAGSCVTELRFAVCGMSQAVAPQQDFEQKLFVAGASKTSSLPFAYLDHQAIY